ncbi:hypothetical protein [Cryobacterium sp. PH29-G1]|uniref:hypothetical protein n=1 Tax=Cryobacterium sp. PH29-G1 TaxID=3046211 RepID=UPI0024BAC6F4|nr:hypothetical protein [Cryobacterium sp. PH29-G1]MDJ0350157.1 hypothetical protein [Cryobacterium sp. PH29-G1]
MVRIRFLLVVAAVFGTLTSQIFSETVTAQETLVSTPIIQLRNTIELPPESGAVAHGNGVDLLAGYTTATGGVKSGGRQNGNRSGTGSDTPAAPRVCAHGDPAKPGITSIPCGNGQFLPLARNNTPATPCTVCSPDTIVRVTDLQNFPAYAAPTSMEPNGWAIVGLATNFWATASTQISEGLLLGQPAQVMFTPTGYHWNYGDSNTISTATGGASWDDLGLAEFSTTATSHTYATKDTYSVVLTVEYHADYSFGDQGWRPVEGTVTVTSTPITVIAANESTVLVAHDCDANPHGPGC